MKRAARVAVAASIALALGACTGEPSETMNSRVTVVEAGKALIGPSLEPIENAIIVIEGTTISAVGTRDEIEIPAGAERVDASGLLVIPGFIDAHVHIGFYSPEEIVANGVTTVRDLAWPPEIIFDLAEESKSPTFKGPTIVAAGPMLTAPGGYPMKASWAPRGTGLPVESASEARAAVEETARSGASVIKIALNPPVGPVLDEEILTAIVESAHDHGLKVTGHISGVDELDKALRSGIDELAHMLMSEERVPRDMIQRMVDQGIVVVPTLSVRFGNDRALAIENLNRFVRAGGKVVYGTDLGNAGPRPGIDPLEIRAMAESGLSGRDIIASATVDSARWLGLDDTGSLETGADADMIAVPTDSLERPAALADVAMVWRLGMRIR